MICLEKFPHSNISAIILSARTYFKYATQQYPLTSDYKRKFFVCTISGTEYNGSTRAVF